MFCTECGTKNANGNKFCRQCGHAVEHSRISEAAYNSALPVEEQISELLERAYTLRAAGDTAAAIGLCEQALHLAPESAAAHSLLGQCCAMQGDRERAIAEYERVLQLNPGSIADRVKLDELRDEGRPKPRPIPTLVRPDKNFGAGLSAWNMAALACGLIALIGTGAALAMQVRSRPTVPALSSAVKTPIVVASAPAPVADRAAVGTDSAASEKEAPADNTTPPRDAFATPRPAPPVTPAATHPQAPAIPQPLPTIDPAPVRTKPAPKTTPKKSGGAGSDGRVVLNSDDGMTKDEQGRYVIRISTDGKTNKTNALPPGASVRIRPGNNSDEGDNAPGSAATASISIADDLRLKGDFDKAMKMYQKALPSAGNRAGHIYQQMGYCFQQKGDHSSAKVNYERAIVEWQKMAAAGHNVETAQISIRACERGIKVCE